jgi:hypothetical protein
MVKIFHLFVANLANSQLLPAIRALICKIFPHDYLDPELIRGSRVLEIVEQKQYAS